MAQSACNARDLGSILGLVRSPGGGGHGNPLQYSCLKNPHGQRSLTGYSPWGRKESDMTERLSHSTHRAKSSASSFLFGSSYPDLKEKKKKNLILGHQDIPNSKPTVLCIDVHQNQLRTFPKQKKKNKKHMFDFQFRPHESETARVCGAQECGL